MINALKLNNFKYLSTVNSLLKNQVKFYHPVREMMKKNVPKFYSDPNEIGEDISRIVALHDKIQDPNKITMGATWDEMGLDSLDFVEIILQVEHEFRYDFGASDWEQFLCINDVAQFMAKDFWAQKH